MERKVEMEAALIWSSKGKDKDGFPAEEEHSVDIYVEEKSVARMEFYESMRSGVDVKTVLEARQEDFELSAHEEGGQKSYAGKALYEGQTYNIIRTYKTGKAKIEMICG